MAFDYAKVITNEAEFDAAVREYGLNPDDHPWEAYRTCAAGIVIAYPPPTENEETDA